MAIHQFSEVSEVSAVIELQMHHRVHLSCLLQSSQHKGTDFLLVTGTVRLNDTSTI
jgi:hypothetical protein